MTTFAQFFHLADPVRSSLELSPEHDAKLLIDLDGVIAWIEERMKPAQQALQMVVTGDFGTGKSHVLRYFEKVIGPKRDLHPIYLELSGFGRRSGFFDLHIKVMSKLVDLLESSVPRHPRRDEFLRRETQLSGDMRRAFDQLALPNTNVSRRALFRSWLIGAGPTPTQARKEGLSGRLFEHAGPAELVGLWKAIGNLILDVDHRSLVVIMDEGESFGKTVNPDAQGAMGAGLRSLFDADNRSLGIVLGLNTPQSREGVHPMLRSDVVSRVTGKQIALNALGDPERIRLFVTALWQKLRGQQAAPALLDGSALDFVSQHLAALRNAISLHQRALATTPTQRDLMRVLAFAGDRAFAAQVSPPLSKIQLERWFQVEGK